jgi:alkanesulfonate monooxygenase SsuD/methylene tetrahydromethanopterin reductase-like flavin-dependent oxidoreductase (luciferase family)
MPGIASAATAVVIGHVAAGTTTIRVGAGGIMLPNHAPLVIAEQFGTLEALYPGRIDLGLGRAPGTDQLTAHALRRTLSGDVDAFPTTCKSCRLFRRRPDRPASVRAFPAPAPRRRVDPGFQPVWRAARGRAGPALRLRLALRARVADAGDRAVPADLQTFGAPAKASPDAGRERRRRRDRRRGPPPADVAAAGVRKPAQRSPTPLPPPVHDFASRLTPQQAGMLDDILACAAIGSPGTVRARLTSLIARTNADELILTSQIYDHATRVRSFEIAAGTSTRSTIGATCKP